jgi:AcrR family transcriptional regulator
LHPKGGRAPRRAGRNRPEILRSAGRVIADRGFEETRFADVAERSGASISTLQYLFGSREDLLIATLRQTVADFLVAVRDAGSSEDDSNEKLRAIVRSMMAADSTDEDAKRDWAVWVEYWRAAARDAELGEEAARTYSAWHEMLTDALTPLAPSGIDAYALAVAATAMIDGFGIHVVLGRPPLDREAAASTVLTWLGAALGNPHLA